MNQTVVQPVNLLVDVTSLQAPLTGIGRYTLEILIQMAQLPEQVELRGFNERRHYEPSALCRLLAEVDEPERPASGLSDAVAQRAWPLAKKVFKRVPGARQLRARLQSMRLVSAAEQCQDGVHWQPNFILGETSRPAMVSVYDLSHVRYAHFHPSDRLRWLEQGLTKTLDKAGHILTVSKFSKAEIVDVYGVSEERISVVPPGVGDAFRHSYSPEELAMVRKQFSLPPNYLLSLGTLEPRKNLKGLIQAYARLSPSLRKRCPLVLAGGEGWNHGETDSLIARLKSRGEILQLGYVPQGLLPQLYQGASAFAYVSLYEGFGMPVAEAMASGVPVMTSNCASMPEVAAGCGQLVDPNNIDSIVEGLNILLSDLRAAPQRCEAARLVSESYSWRTAAEDLINVATTLRRSV